MISGCNVGSSEARPPTFAAWWPNAGAAVPSPGSTAVVGAGRATVTTGAGAGGGAGEGPKFCHRKRTSRISMTAPRPLARYTFFLSSVPTLMAISGSPPPVLPRPGLHLVELEQRARSSLSHADRY